VIKPFEVLFCRSAVWIGIEFLSRVILNLQTGWGTGAIKVWKWEEMGRMPLVIPR
jgi:hypothetical protein